jgi:hypothetical protein
MGRLRPNYILRIVELVDERRRRGRKEMGSIDPNFGRTAPKTASIIGISPKKVVRTRTVLDYADEDTKQEVLEGKKSIHKAYVETQERRRCVETETADIVDF